MANIFRATGAKFSRALGRSGSSTSVVPQDEAQLRRTSTLSMGSAASSDGRRQSWSDALLKRFMKRRPSTKPVRRASRRISKSSGPCHSSGGDSDCESVDSCAMRETLKRLAGRDDKQATNEQELRSLYDDGYTEDSKDFEDYIIRLTSSANMLQLTSQLQACYACPGKDAAALIKFVGGDAWIAAGHCMSRQKQQLEEAKANLGKLRLTSMKEISSLRDKLRRSQGGEAMSQVCMFESLSVLDPDTRALAEVCVQEKMKELLAKQALDFEEKTRGLHAKQAVELEAAVEKEKARVAEVLLESEQLRAEISRLQAALREALMETTNNSSASSSELPPMWDQNGIWDLPPSNSRPCNMGTPRAPCRVNELAVPVPDMPEPQMEGAESSFAGPTASSNTSMTLASEEKVSPEAASPKTAKRHTNTAGNPRAPAPSSRQPRKTPNYAPAISTGSGTRQKSQSRK
eukprot:TRINITY_DN13080_c0_g1_i2.p1 TRINITY_DN13080_c0_g1~~TRINITY_DN13080_c0_g1_i2.p1  ORF type:complete len:461 (-),score=72.37 TRINITY_DN13080_c0_g1_i2:287-1669(-)